MAKAFTVLTPDVLAKSLAHKFIPLADNLRDMNTSMGLRPYIVCIVKTRWTDGERGEGSEYVESITNILPTPLVSDLSSIAEILHPIGLDEAGSIQVSEISGRYTEEQLRGLKDDGSEQDPDVHVYWEVEYVRADGVPGEHRRFTLSGAPYFDAGNIEWKVRLDRTHGERTRAGEPR